MNILTIVGDKIKMLGRCKRFEQNILNFQIDKYIKIDLEEDYNVRGF